MQLDPLRWAKFFAATKHGTQKYSNGMPYTHHLAAVEAVLRRFLPDWKVENLKLGRVELEYDYDQLLQAAWLHDVVEDTGTKLKEIEEMFGPEVAALVSAVTNEKGENRKIRHALTYPKTRAGGPMAVRLKLADRIANVEAGGSLVQMYKKEHEDFRRALYTENDGNHDMWKHLDGLMEKA